MTRPIEFHVWVQVEREGPGDDEYENEGLPDKLTTFDTFEEAAAFIRTLPGWFGRVAETSNYRERAEQVLTHEECGCIIGHRRPECLAHAARA